MKIAFIGLGSMGRPMARNLIAAGHDLKAWNRNATAVQGDELLSSRLVGSPDDAVADVECVVSMLSDDAAIRGVFLSGAAPGRTLIDAMTEGTIHLCMSTISVELARELAEGHASRSLGFVCAPVFGRPPMAEAAKLTIVAGGAANAVELCRPLLDAMGAKVAVVGDDASRAAVVKLAGNFMLVSMLEAMGEAVALARRSGVDADTFIDIVTGGLFRSPVYEAYGSMIAQNGFEPAGFKLRLGLKDVRLVLAAADRLDVPMPLASLAHDRLLEALAAGLGEQDWAAMARIAARNAGLD